MIPTHVNNIFGIRMNSLTNNASMTYGNSAQKGHQSNMKQNNGYWQPGDAYFSPVQFNVSNISQDPDALDQPQAQV